jgi:hypothetical protein
MIRRYFTAPEHVVSCDLGRATVIVNYRSGRVHTLVGMSARCWNELAASGDMFKVTSMDPGSVERLVGRFLSTGLLVGSAAPTAWAPPLIGRPWQLSFGTVEAQAGRAHIPHTPLITRLLVAVSLLVTLSTMHIGRRPASMGRLLRLLELATSRTTRSATSHEVEEVVHAVRRVGQFAPSRVACLEESVAVVLALAASRRRVTWCHGVAADPVRLHAWVEADGSPVAEPASTRRCTTLRTIPERN